METDWGRVDDIIEEMRDGKPEDAEVLEQLLDEATHLEDDLQVQKEIKQMYVDLLDEILEAVQGRQNVLLMFDDKPNAFETQMIVAMHKYCDMKRRGL